MPATNTFHWERGDDGVVVVTMDDPDQSANTMNQTYVESMGATLDRIEAERERITGVVLTSAKDSFFAGGDVNRMIRATPEQAEDLTQLCATLKSQLRRMETLGKPVVAAINGTALGGGLEIALACHHRIALDTAGARIGLPEVTLGLLPGAGGVTRTVRLLGLQDALTKVLLRGQRYRPSEAVSVGLVHELAESEDALLARAREWIGEHPDAAQPWDTPGYSIPGGTPSHPAMRANLPAFPANLRKETKGANPPAPRNILAAAVEGAQVDIDTAFAVESSYLVELMGGQVSTNMMNAFFFDTRHIESGGSRPEGHAPHTARKVAVLGAGMMGAGIAHVCARGGMDVVLRDVSLEAAERGKRHSATALERAVERGGISADRAERTLARITPTDTLTSVAGCDLVIEAVFEDSELKRRVLREVEPLVTPDAVLGSNTSTLPIDGLARGVRRPDDLIGLHFFSPVDKMPLLEIIVGERTSDATLAKAFDIARQINKTPIVVNDRRGFFTSRVIGRFIDEAQTMVAEGLHPASVEQAGLQAGYPTAPLALADELNLKLTREIRREFQEAAAREGTGWAPGPADLLVDRMLDEFDRPGRLEGRGFYDYADGKRDGIWAGIREHYTVDGHTIPFEDMKERMLFAESLDSVRCLDEGVLRSVPDANVGSLLGIGFPAWTGGVIQYINGYPEGPAGFVGRARELADRYGPRFLPPDSLVSKARRGETYA
ncbi:3-hydroxyacyl-CoA dehydrogenase NAD-binding domain-containing protein [Halostreptopolyspora alba]|uniref:3-hydroxyacyl-CoA dehydrogenase n=1 Tax=Halostreptopolyspora alba TaxID=2487137 RepID=A0A3N0E2X0_9ACTN|nr:3-hydroxyacyl-CoA dehydrogenase [Nocardiopsaceae bacterium YIM 96095]